MLNLPAVLDPVQVVEGRGLRIEKAFAHDKDEMSLPHDLVAIEPENVEAYPRTAKVVISLCDHIVAIGENSHRMNSCTCWWMKHQFPDAGWAIRDLQIMLRIAGTYVGKRTEISRSQALQKGGHPVDPLRQ